MSLNIDSIVEGTTAGVVASVLLGAFAVLRNRVRNLWLRFKIHRSLRLVGYGTSIAGVTINVQNRTGTDITIREAAITTDAMEYLLNPTGDVSSSFPAQYPRLTRAQKKKLKAGEQIQLTPQRRFASWRTQILPSGFAKLTPFTDQTLLLPTALVMGFDGKVTGVRMVAEYASHTNSIRILKKTVRSVAEPLQKTIDQFKASRNRRPPQ